MKRLMIPFTACVVIALTACTPDQNAPMEGQAYVPVYYSEQNIQQISTDLPKVTTDPGKIYAYGNYIFQNDKNSGIHIIDVSDKKHPRKTAFINIPFSNELAVKGHYLYADNYKDMVVFDISDPERPVMIKRMENVFKPVNQDYPPYINVLFECPDASKGVVVGWKLEMVKSPKCRR
ncbi:hypothetical protein [Pinibacter soli]|uniref:LVIVD repeat-containing protein n=1 Tax=Pinibacter soli TaxID=3044211 RepID=A0ABT6R6R1_9BACT|nr:hypothetical protein [Pinibacter soli]MDI3318248.1 hypothetical protein [Pinibacter soli]